VAERIDLLIIGLGPAGAAAARVAAQGGISVAVIERKQTAGVPVQCAEFIPLPLGAYARPEGVLQQRIRGMNSALPSGAMEKSEFPGLMVDRAAFDQALAREAEKAGARVFFDSRLERLEPAQNRAWIATPQGERVFEYKVLVGADGPHSPVAAALGLPPLEVVHTRQYTVPLLRPFEDTDIWLSDAYPGGYAWLFPKRETANLGLGADKRFAADLKTPLDELHRNLVSEGRVGIEILHRTGGAIPVGGMRPKISIGNVMLTGDAAGLTHPVTGAGIAAAVVSGDRAGEAAVARVRDKVENALGEFEEDIRDQFEASLARAVAKRQWLNQFWGGAEARGDEMHRRGWIAFPEYFTN
jgi:geranylgeranyl reductase family protein